MAKVYKTSNLKLYLLHAACRLSYFYIMLCYVVMLCYESIIDNWLIVPFQRVLAAD